MGASSVEPVGVKDDLNLVAGRPLWLDGCHDMVTHMKTTIEISDPILEAAKEAASREGRTLRDVVEEALRVHLAARARRPPFKLRDASFQGEGMHGDMNGLTWEQLVSLIYEGRGG